MTWRVEFSAWGAPATQGSKKLGRGRRHLIDDNPRTKPWRTTIATACAAVLPAGWVPVNEPCLVQAEFVLPRAKARRGLWLPAGVYGAGDVDKLARALFDALTEGRVWVDDHLGCGLLAVKRFANPDEPVGVHVVVVPWEPYC